jgi:hypothetical protein
MSNGIGGRPTPAEIGPHGLSPSWKMHFAAPEICATFAVAD